MVGKNFEGVPPQTPEDSGGSGEFEFGDDNIIEAELVDEKTGASHEPDKRRKSSEEMLRDIGPGFDLKEFKSVLDAETQEYKKVVDARTERTIEQINANKERALSALQKERMARKEEAIQQAIRQTEAEVKKIRGGYKDMPGEIKQRWINTVYRNGADTIKRIAGDETAKKYGLA